VLRRLVDARLIEEVENNRIRVSDPEKLDLVAKGLFPEA